MFCLPFPLKVTELFKWYAQSVINIVNHVNMTQEQLGKYDIVLVFQIQNVCYIKTENLTGCRKCRKLSQRFGAYV